MAISARRKHLINRIAALIKNLEKIEEAFTLDKSLDRQVEKMEAVMTHQSQKNAYRKAAADRRKAQQKEEQKQAEAADKANAEQADAGQATVEITAVVEDDVQDGE